MGINFKGGYDHYHCTFNGQVLTNRGLLKVFGQREYINVLEPTSFDRFSEILKIEINLTNGTADKIHTTGKSFFGSARLKMKGLKSIINHGDSLMGFSSE